MGTREVSSQPWRGDSVDAFDALRSRWRTASLASGWPYPGEWGLAEVDLVCAAVLAGAAPDGALVRLGRARAEAGTGLGETLRDIAALHAVLTMPNNTDGMMAADPDVIPSRLLRVAALAWSDVLVQQVARSEVCDALTGLANAAYLRARLREVYREAGSMRVPAAARYTLLALTPDLRTTTGWSRLAAMVLLADVLRTVFDGGQTLAVLGSATFVVLSERDDRMPERMCTVRWLAQNRLGVDPQLRDIAAPMVRAVPLPATHDGACRLLTDLTRG